MDFVVVVTGYVMMMYTRVNVFIPMLNNARIFYSAMYVDAIFTREFQYLTKLLLLYCKSVVRK